MLSIAKHLFLSAEILRYAQNDKLWNRAHLTTTQ
jgi:hypothetical protein